MLLDSPFRTPARRATAAVVSGVAATGVLAAVAYVASPARAAVLGSITVSPTSGTDSTLIGGSVTANCPGGTDNTDWFLTGGSLDPNAADGYLGSGTAAGTGSQSFDGASIANLRSTSTNPINTGTYQIAFRCNSGSMTTDTYAANFNYDAANGGSWTVSAVTPSPTATPTPTPTVTVTAPSAPGTPTATAPTTGGSATLSWTAPGSDGGASISSYTVKAYTGSTLAKTVTGVAATSTTVTGLGNGTTYTFRVAAVNSAGTGPESAASNAVTPRVATKLVITSAPSKLTYGIAFKVVGKLTRSNGTTAVPGQVVYLQARKKGTTSYVNVAKATSSSTGGVAVIYKPVFAVDALRLSKPTVGAYLGSLSAGKAVTTQRRITTTWSSRQIYLGRSATLSGYVYPRGSGLRVTLQRKKGTSWVTVVYKTLPSTTAGYSRYAFTVKPTVRTTYYYRVIVAPGHGYTTSVALAPSLKVV